MDILERVKADRLLRWSAYAATPFVWLGLALFNPLLFLIPPLIYVALERAMAYGMIERNDPVPRSLTSRRSRARRQRALGGARQGRRERPY